MGRNDRAALANQTLQILEAGSYTAPDGRTVEICPAVKSCVNQTKLIQPQDWSAIVTQAETLIRLPQPTTIQVTPETTLAAARRLIGTGANILALNFASAKNPGGGFLGGSQAQEESLARASALYPSLLAAPLYYSANRASSTLLYTDHAIYSPNVPVIRDDSGELLADPYHLTFLTIPAPNIGAMKPDSSERHDVAATFARRIQGIYALAALQKHDALILGAWGCGVFRNDPAQVAQFFRHELEKNWRHHFKHICFAVYDSSPLHSTLAAFEQVFPPNRGMENLP